LRQRYSGHCKLSRNRGIVVARFVFFETQQIYRQIPTFGRRSQVHWLKEIFFLRKELEYWHKNRESSKLILVLTDGTVKWNAKKGDFDWSMTNAIPKCASGAFTDEPLFIDFRALKEEKLSTRHPEFLDRIATLAATLHGEEKDEIAGEHVRQHRNTIRIVFVAVATLCILAIAATIFGVVSRQRGKRIDAQNVELNESFVDSQLSLGTALIRERRMAEGLWRYWLAYENTAPDDMARQSALKLIGAWSQLAGRPLVHDSGLREVAFSRNGDTVLTLTDRVAQLWDIGTGEPIGEKVTAVDSAWQAIAVGPDAATVIVASNAAAQIWDVRTAKPRGEPFIHGEKISKVSISADGTTILTQSKGLIRFWSAQTGKRIGKELKLNRPETSVLAPDGKSIFLGFDDQRLFDVSSGESTKVPFWPYHDRSNHIAAFSPDGKLLIAAGNTDEEIRDYEHAEVWRVGSAQEIKSKISHRGSFSAFAFSADSGTILTGGDDNIAYVWYLDGNELKSQGPPLSHGGTVASATFGYDRATTITTILTGSTDKTARLWKILRLKTIVPTYYPFRHSGTVNCVAMSADSRTVLTGSSDGIARIWNPAVRIRAWDSESLDAANNLGVDQATIAPEVLEAVFNQEPSAKIAAISPNKNVVAIRGENNTVRLRHISTGELVGKPLQHRGAVLAVTFSLDGRFVATGSADNTAAIWDAQTATLLGTELAHDDAVNGLDFSPDGTTLITASGDTKARLWDVASGAMCGDPLLHSYKVQEAKFVSDGRRVITRASGAYWSDDGYWNVAPPAVDEPERLKLSIEWRTGYRINSAQRVSRLTQSEWLASKRKLDSLGGPCDAVSWDDLTLFHE
jgi:WD40 repeat protein